MTCEEARDRFEDLLKERLSSDDVSALRRHLADCPACSAEFEVWERQKLTVRLRATRHQPSLDFEQRVRRKLGRGEGFKDVAAFALRSLWSGRSATIAITVLVTLIIALPLYHKYWIPKQDPILLVVTESVDDYIRIGLRQSSPTTLPDPLRVKSWLENRLGFSPELRFWGDNEYLFIGGVPTYFLDRKVATLVFKGDQSLSTLSIFPGSDLKMPEQGRRQVEGFKPYLGSFKGYQALFWKQGQLAYVIVTAAGEKELLDFFLKVRKSIP
ncbi:MAG: zf-HC2 domain-containing protein [Candidatus Tectomicrobia bacterium]|nr:zf-HC2 domain-containing protein [Candidatus Tectomicrobia bacterium]